MTNTPQDLAVATLDAALLALAAAAALYDGARDALSDIRAAEEEADTAATQAAAIYDAACDLVTAARASAGFEA